MGSSPDDDSRRIPWHKNVNGVWIPTAMAISIGATLVEMGRLVETIHTVQQGQASSAINIAAEHDQINRRIGDVERAIEDLKVLQAVETEHTKTQDAKIDQLEHRR